MCSLMWLRKKRPTPHFKMLCGRASRSGFLEERAHRAMAQTREVFRAFEEVLTLEEFSHLKKQNKTQKQIMENAGTIILPLMGVTSQPPWIFTLRRCQKLKTIHETLNQKHSLVQRPVFLGAKNRHPSGSFHGFIQLKSLPSSVTGHL